MRVFPKQGRMLLKLVTGNGEPEKGVWNRVYSLTHLRIQNGGQRKEEGTIWWNLRKCYTVTSFSNIHPGRQTSRTSRNTVSNLACLSCLGPFCTISLAKYCFDHISVSGRKLQARCFLFFFFFFFHLPQTLSLISPSSFASWSNLSTAMTLPFLPAMSFKVCLLIPPPMPTATVYKPATCQWKRHEIARFYWDPAWWINITN